MRTKAKELKEKIIEYLLTNFRENGKEKITEEKIASYFKISRTPVREVLKSLENEGLISVRRNRGIKIRKFSKEDIKKVYDVRIILEEYAIKEAIKNLKEENIKKLREYVRNYNKARKEGKWLEAKKIDQLFHEKIVELSGNWYLNYLVKKLNVFSFFFSLPKKDQKYRIDPNPYSHNRILKALIKKDHEIASETIRNHILWIQNYTLKNYEKRG